MLFRTKPVRKMVRLMVTFPNKGAAILTAEAKAQGLTRAEIVRKAVDFYIMQARQARNA